MRHSVFGKKLGRDTHTRKALLNSLASSLLINGSITTTHAKAKFVRPYVEKMITDAKESSMVTNRKLASMLSKQAFNKLISEIGPGFEARQSGYTRIVKVANRLGDNAPIAKIEFLEWDKTKTKTFPKSPKPTLAKKTVASKETKAQQAREKQTAEKETKNK